MNIGDLTSKARHTKPTNTTYVSGGSGVFNPNKGRVEPANITPPKPREYTAPREYVSPPKPRETPQSPNRRAFPTSPTHSSFQSDLSDTEWRAKPASNNGYSRKVIRDTLGEQAAVFGIKKNIKSILALFMTGVSISKLELEYNKQFS